MDYGRILRRLRQRIFDYPDSTAEKADRVLRAVKVRHLRQRDACMPLVQRADSYQREYLAVLRGHNILPTDL